MKFSPKMPSFFGSLLNKLERASIFDAARGAVPARAISASFRGFLWYSGFGNGRISSGAAQNTFGLGRGDLYEIAAAYAFHIAESQAFLDGNKRTASASAISFLTLNGVNFPVDDGPVYKAMIDIAKKRLDKPGLAKVLRKIVEANT